MADTKIYIVTGGNSGLGLGCSLALAKQANVHLIVVGHHEQRVAQAVEEIQQVADASSKVDGVVADLASLASVQQFCNSVKADHAEIAGLICCAGVGMGEKQLTVDGFERTLAVNHIGHFLMIKQLHDRTKRIITVSSHAHAMAAKIGLPEPNVSDLDQLAVGYDNFNPREAYVTSKLLGVVLAKEYARRYPDGAEILSFSPVFMKATNLYRHTPSFDAAGHAAFLQSRGVPVDTPERFGLVLADMVTTNSWEAKGWKSGDYVTIVAEEHESELARDEELGSQLWTKSEEWIARAP